MEKRGVIVHILVCLLTIFGTFSLPAFGAHFLAEEEQFYMDRFVFSGQYPDMETMEIHAERKKRVQFNVTGSFPKLESVVYKGSFGLLRSKIKGECPELSSVNLSCTSCRMDLDFRGEWKKNASIYIRNEQEPITIMLPKDIGVVVYTQVDMNSKVVAEGSLIKRGRGFWKKTFRNSLVGESPVTLTFHVETRNGGVIFLR
ncbi:hypothetical protein [Chlamydia trachomatis]|uniref:Hypothetical membrane associated protein n=1 Tax=Chlamydia trachomatis serovar A (strain ATCC VR-571B / DSM 19440 / HAR-13) TaxID=315277 RepID=A0A0H2X2D2_CHLTA|nr:hypothetical protein [Chlamydia trachomatis]AAX50745.1 hypothetical membrane associated protein [Chlamydia trachomatis A/HAR-13]AGR97626.1 hypothetical protein CTRC953_02460 [Chlamydia trachomatis RC-J/953]AGS00410.1 hypothetical protein CTRC122_02495 [Chlamydia trachomatis RC-J(s)/122]AGS02278.1 hypothetical protein CTJTET1_02480 [Chlamydia trachomatis J/6276tet1]AGS03235.1 hypothetical protein CTRC971_02465 [Chlamydia trachomatis RC-J/971]